MRFRQGDMWSVWGSVDLFLVTTNATLTQAGKLVMGRGIARQARDRFPGLDLVLGDAIDIAGPDYGLLVSFYWPAAKLGCFQVKRHWADRADLDLIARSVQDLSNWCSEHPSATVALNFPGIGNGRLEVNDVLPLVKGLPNTVQIWQRQ